LDYCAVHYTVSLQGAGTLGGTAFTATTVTFRFDSDTTQIIDLGDGTFVTPNGVPGTYDIAGFSCGIITTSLHLFVDQTCCPEAVVGINPDPDFLSFANAAYATYDLTTPIGPVNSTSPNYLNRSGLATNNGQLVLSSVRDISFTATIGRFSCRIN
jgi:hypothetical protein